MGHVEEIDCKKIERNGKKYLVSKSRCKTGDEVKVTIKIKKEKSKSSKDGTADRSNGHDVPVYRAGSWGDLLMRKKSASESSAGNDNGHAEHGQDDKIDKGIYLQVTEEKRTTRRPKLVARGRSGDRNRNFESAEEYIDKYYVQDSSHGVKDAGDSVVDGRCCGSCVCSSRPNRDSDVQTRKDAGTSMRMSFGGQKSHVVEKSCTTEPTGGNGNAAQTTRSVPERTNKKLDTVLEEEENARRISLENRRVYAEAIDNARRRLEELQRENQMLKSDTEKLHEQVGKAQRERSEYVTTIKELYELAEILRRENGLLIETHDEYKQLQTRFEDLPGENQLLRQYVEEVTTSKLEKEKEKRQSKGGTTANNSNENQHQLQEFLKVLDTLKEVKTVIADEIQGFQKASVSKMDVSNRVELQDFLRKSNSNRSATVNMNDSNIQCDDEIQEIFRNSNLRKDPTRSEVRSSTQYLDVEDVDPFEHIRRFVPSPDAVFSD